MKRDSHFRLSEHETSRAHLEAEYCFNMRASSLENIDNHLLKQLENEKNYWTKILTRVIDIIIYLVEGNLAFRGDNEILGDQSSGNFLRLVKLLSKYDDFLNLHIEKHAQQGSGHVNYLSSTIYEQLIEIIGNRLLDTILIYIKDSKYFGLSADSTTDVGHVDQLSLSVRYLENLEPVERFLLFMDNEGHTAKKMFDAIKAFIEKHLIELKFCRAVSFDNATVMSGQYNGLRTLIQQKSPTAAWVPCIGHSLNLVGTSTMSCCLETAKFFDFLENVYVFFTKSTDRYDLLKKKLKELKKEKDRAIMPKKVDTTRWASRKAACKSVKRGYNAYVAALEELSSDNEEAKGLLKIFKRLETGINVSFWYEILEMINIVSTQVQNATADLNTSVRLLKSLKDSIESLRDNFKNYESLGKNISDCDKYEQNQKRKRTLNVRNKPLDYGHCDATEFSDSDDYRINTFIRTIDTLTTSLVEKIAAYSDLDNTFGFLSRLPDLNLEEIKGHSQKVLEVYKEDLEENLTTELLFFKNYVKNFIKPNEADDKNKVCIEVKMLKLIKEKNLQSLPNVTVLLSMYLVIMTTNCTCERAFSKLKIINNRMRSAMTQNRLNNLTRMSAECDLLHKIDYSDIIEDFAQKKSRKVPL